MAGQLGADGLQQPHLAGHLGGQVGEGDGGVIAVELKRGCRGGPPVIGPGGALLSLGGLGDHRQQSGSPGSQQRPRVCPPFQHCQVGLGQVPGQRAVGQQLAGQVLDPPLVQRTLLGQPVTGPHPAVQRSGLRAVGQLQRLQAPGCDQRQPGQGVGVDAVALGVPGQEPPQIGGLGAGHPEHPVPTGGEEHRDRQPGRTGRLHHHLQAGARNGAGQRRGLHRGQALHRRASSSPADLAAITAQHADGVVAGDAQIHSDQATFL